MKAHELSQIIPPMETADLQSLVENIRQEGLKEEIVLHEGKILDGNSRFAACKLAGVKPITRDFGSRKSDGEDPLKFVLAENVHRRHLTDHQRTMIASELAQRSLVGRPVEKKEGEEANGESVPPPTPQEEAAKLLNVSTAAVRRGVKVLKKGSAKLKEALRSGEVSISKAADAADSPKDRQMKVAKAPRKKAKRETAKDKIVLALDEWWVENKEKLEKTPMCPPAGMVRNFRKIIEKVL